MAYPLWEHVLCLQFDREAGGYGIYLQKIRALCIFQHDICGLCQQIQNQIFREEINSN